MARIRTGSYKHSFFTAEELRGLWSVAGPTIMSSHARFEKGLLSAAEFAGAVMGEIWQAARPDRWHNGRRSRRASEPEVAPSSPLFLIQNFRWRGIPPAALEILLEWHRGAVPLQLCFGIPDVETVLADQCEGRRCVSILLDPPERFFEGAEGRDGFSFLLHDLLHASHFYRELEHFRRQVFFSRWMLSLLRGRRELRSEAFDYLASDMNTHWVHSMKCLKSIVPPENRDECLEALNRLAGKGASENIAGLWRILNTPEENEDARVELDRNCSRFLETALADVITPATFV